MAYDIDEHKLSIMRLVNDSEDELKYRQIINQMNKHQSLNDLDETDYVNRHFIDTHQSPSSRDNEYEMRISVLSDENQDLRQKYVDLLQRINKLIDAYRKLKSENTKLKSKKEIREYLDKTLSGLWNMINDGLRKIIIWFNT